jgi:SPP1 family predicted phage head-tail adaptor
MPVLTLNRRITLERKSTAQDATGHPVETWPTARTAMAHVEYTQSGERMRASQELATRVATFTIRWFAGLNAGDWRIAFDGLTWDILGIAEPPNTRRQFWAITAAAGGA